MLRTLGKALRMALLLGVAASLVYASALGVDWLRGGGGAQLSGQDPPAGDHAVPCVVCSIHPVSAMVDMVGGEDAEIVTLLPPGADPHTFELKPSQAVRLRKADLIVLVGGGADSFVEGLIAAAGAECPVIRLLETVPTADLLTEGGGASADPHIWLDPVIARRDILPALAAALAEICPTGDAAAYQGRLQTAVAKLEDLHAWADSQIGPVRDKALITMHPAWGYFGRRYGIETYSVLAHHGSEPTPRHLEELLGLAQERGVKVLFRERQVPTSSLDVLVRSGGGQVMLLDPLGGPGVAGYETYPDLLRSNVLTMVRGLTLP